MWASSANNIGNLVNRTVSMVQRYCEGVIPALGADNVGATDLRAARTATAPAVDRALGEFDFRRAAEAITKTGDKGNRYVEAARPWELAKAERTGQADSGALDAVLAELVATCRHLAEHLEPFLPTFARRIAQQCGNGSLAVADPNPVFPRLELLDS